MAGLQCHKMLWWQVHDPIESGDIESQSQFSRGNQVGAAARDFVPGGILIDAPYYEVEERVTATQAAIEAGAPVIYEASFLEDGLFVSVDILERRPGGYALVEVKATVEAEEHHIPDVAVQLHVLQRAGLTVKRVEIMHLNRECRHPDLSNLFIRENVTARARKAARSAPSLIRKFAQVLAAKLPDVETGDHCGDPYPCPFMDRCWPLLPPHHVSSLYRITSKALAQLIDDGFETLHDLPEEYAAKGTAKRQIESVRGNKVVVESGLSQALSAVRGPIAFLDFETVAPAIPSWPGCSPYTMVPVQLSCHLQTATGTEHHAWLAEGSEDPRPAFAQALIKACEGAETILAYNAPFEKARIAEVMKAFPKYKLELSGIHARIQDLLPIVRNHVYHPDFNGSFSIKSVLPALVPDLGYDDLDIRDGGAASAALESVLFGTELAAEQQNILRKQLLAYCERDTWAMVRVYERLTALAGASINSD